MKVMVVGHRSNLSKALIPFLSSFADVVLAGRSDSDVVLDLCGPLDKFVIPSGLDVVINLAACFGGTDTADIDRSMETNVLGAYKLAQACTANGVKTLLQVSSIFSHLTDSSPFYSSYALSKKYMEKLLEMYCKSAELNLTIVRPTQLYGEGDEFRKHQPSIYRMLDQAQNGEDVVIYGKNDALRNFMHVDDAAKTIALAVSQELFGSYDSMNLSNIRLSDIANAALSAFDSSRSVIFDVGKPDIPDNIFNIDTSIFGRLGFLPQISMDQGMVREAVRRMGEA